MSADMARAPSAAAGRNDEVICFCFALTRGQILEALARPETSYADLISETGVGTACAACRLNLEVIVGEAISFRGPVDSRASSQSWLRVPADQRNCGYFVNRDGLKTVLRVANPDLPNVKERVPLATYRLEVDVFDAVGRRVARHVQPIGVQRDVSFDFSEIAEVPDYGWFTADLIPLSEGFVGNPRPQVAITGHGWCSTYHMQLETYASKRRTLLLDVCGGGTHSMFALINTRTVQANVLVTLEGLDRAFTATRKSTISPRGVVLFEIDREFNGLPDGALLVAAVDADIPIRRYFWTRHADGSLSMDHFPNTR